MEHDTGLTLQDHLSNALNFLKEIKIRALKSNQFEPNVAVNDPVIDATLNTYKKKLNLLL